jgi:carboxymethylenebutenolidase
MPRPQGFASHLIVASLAFGIGAGGTYVFRAAAKPMDHVHDEVTTHGETVWVKKPAGDSVRVYVAYPERSDPAPAVIVIHENQGLTTWEPTVADKLAGNGYIAAAVDLPSSMFGLYPADSGRAYIPRLTPDGVTADLNAVYEYLNGLRSVRKDQIGVIGFCWGGGQSFRYATNNPKLKAAVVCYGIQPDTLAMPRINARVLGVYGEADNRINSNLSMVSDVMQRLGKSFVADSYPGTGHGFLKPGRRGSDTDQPDKAWAKILAFFGETIGK